MKNFYLHLDCKVLVTLIAILWSFSLLCGIDFTPGAETNISNGFSNDRDRSFSYNTGQDDQHWFGTDKWAVRFDFAAEYPTFTKAKFIIREVQLYFPVVSDSAPYDSVKIEIWSDLNNLPHTRLYIQSEGTPVISHYTNIYLPANEIDTLGVAWLVVNYNTAVNGNLVSASSGDGTHSYFWNINAPTNPYFQNMANAGYASEFLFNVRGEFKLNNPDLELASADVNPIPVINGRVTPYFTIINNSGLTINHPSINVTLSNPDSLSNPVQDIFQILTPILPNGVLTVSGDDPLYPGHTYPLPSFSTQLKFKAVLHSEYDVADTLSNNTIIKYYDCFNRSMPINLVENFILSDQSANLLQTQDNLITPEFRILDYFPVVNDDFYALGASQRFTWYNFAGLPMTVVDGNGIIPGYSATYADVFSSALAAATSQLTFLENVGTSVSLPNANLLRVRANFRNSATYLYDSTLDPSLLRHSVFFGALIRNTTLNGAPRLFFNRWGAYADTISTALQINESYEKTFEISLQDIPVDNLAEDYQVFYWIQNLTTKKIVYANFTDLNHVSTGDDTTPVTSDKLTLAPNPARLGQALTVTLPAKYNTGNVTYKLYNLKGQCVLKEKVTGHVIHVDTDKIPSAGMYLLKVSISSEEGEHQLIKRLVVF